MSRQRVLIFLGMLGLLAPQVLGNVQPAFAADLLNVRVKPQADRTEVVMDLAGKAEAITLNKENPNDVIIRFPGKIATGVEPHSQSFDAQDHLKSLNWDAKDGAVTFHLKPKASQKVKIFPLANPDRLLVIVEDAAQLSNSTRVVGPGVIHKHIVKSTARGPLNINVLDIDPRNSQISIEPVLASSSLHGKAKVSQMVSRNGAFAGINASFFKPDSGTVLGTVILNRELLAGPIYNRVSLGITPDKTFKMSRISLKGAVTGADGRVLPLHNVNQPRLSREQYILYSSRWGKSSPKTPPNGVQLQIQNNQITAVSESPLSIPANGYVLVGPASGLATALNTGDPITLKVFTTPDWSDVDHAVSGGPYLVKDGQIYVDLREQSFRLGEFTKAAPRTAVGFTADNHLLMVTVDGRQNHVSVGVTLTEMAKLMKELGAVEAMNFDGGSSTQMVVRGRVVNSPSVAGGANVSASLVVRQIIPNEVIGATSNVSTPNF